MRDKLIYLVTMIVAAVCFTIVGVSTPANAVTPVTASISHSQKVEKVGALSAASSIPKSGSTLKQCKTEDSSNCFWDARLHGSGKSKSFVNVGGLIYFFPKYESKASNLGAPLKVGGTMPLCKYEDSRNCFFDSSNVGNKLGDAFIDFNGRVLYVDYSTEPVSNN